VVVADNSKDVSSECVADVTRILSRLHRAKSHWPSFRSELGILALFARGDVFTYVEIVSALYSEIAGCSGISLLIPGELLLTFSLGGI
jgi:hypothetical protein